MRHIVVTPVAVIGWLALLGWAGASSSRPAVTVEKARPEVRVDYFNPANPPTDMPVLKADEAAITQSQFSVGSTIEVSIIQQRQENGQERVTARVERVKVNLDLTITVWLPENATEKLTAHEMGHKRISESYYGEAEKKAEEFARQWLGKELEGRGKDLHAAAEVAMNQAMQQINGRYMAAVSAPSSTAQSKYDDLTDHGRNNLPEAEAIRKAIEAVQQTKNR